MRHLCTGLQAIANCRNVGRLRTTCYVGCVPCLYFSSQAILKLWQSARGQSSKYVPSWTYLTALYSPILLLRIQCHAANFEPMRYFSKLYWNLLLNPQFVSINDESQWHFGWLRWFMILVYSLRLSTRQQSMIWSQTFSRVRRRLHFLLSVFVGSFLFRTFCCYRNYLTFFSCFCFFLILAQFGE